MRTKKTVELFALEISDQSNDFMALSHISEVLGDAGMKIAAEVIEAQNPRERVQRAMSVLSILEDQIHSYYKDKLPENVESGLSQFFGNPLEWTDQYTRDRYGKSLDEHLDDKHRREES